MTDDDSVLEQRLTELFTCPRLDATPQPDTAARVLLGVRRRRRTRQQLTAAGAFGLLAAGLLIPQLPPIDRPSGRGEASPAAGPAPTATSSSATLTMTPGAVGALRLGMSREQALATGLLTDLTPMEAPLEGCITSAGLNGISSVVIGPHGVESIRVNAFISTPEGLQVGDRLRQVRQTYPALEVPNDLDVVDAVARAPIPGVTDAWYKIYLDASDVTTRTSDDDARVGGLALEVGSTQCSAR